MFSKDHLIIGGKEYKSRLILGTGKYRSLEVMRDSLEASGTEIVTVALRRVDLNEKKGLLEYIDLKKYKILPNTAGCYHAEEAIRYARLGREVGMSNLVKLEVIGDQKTLYPDNEETIKAARVLVDEGFEVLPYITDDLIVSKKLEKVGCVGVMPLGSAIGSGQGIKNRERIRIIVAEVGIPVIVDAGVGTASDVAIAMELGCDGVLLNTAIAKAEDSVMMARAMKYGVEAGRLAYCAGRMEKREYGQASSPKKGILE